MMCVSHNQLTCSPAIELALYGTSDSRELSTQQKDNLSALASLASGIAAG
nr:hypothetical protein [Lonsdalea iberica]